MLNTVAVILGSDSDIEIYEKVSAVLTEFEVSFEKRIISAHRTPDLLRDYVIGAEKKGIKVFIAIAGMAAALPGVIASFTTRPVIGVPVALKSPVMGFDSLFSMLQMPPGIPVATVAVNGGKNAGLLALEILALTERDLSDRLKSFKNNQREKVVMKDQQFQKDS
ncbi:MAG: 5-(carboxyamino)imidazole ribonucleotide mutase [Spirochaetes bacterium]|jgi:5-(carboxyamino)imidazole ribonucleotide mutase|nr:5-(carboxyamino)imidazole ribonucleotide mutase [Spirochaetota bacterium]